MNKKTLLFGMVALLFATISCKKQETYTDTIEASIVTENNGDRTYLYDNIKVGWSGGDVIRVWGATGDPKDYTLTDNSTDPRNGTFSCGHGGVQEGNSYLGFYPIGIITSRNGDNVTFTTTGTQDYVDNNFHTNANPMVAKASTPKLPFKNVFGLMKIELKGNYTVTKIELSDPSNALWGQFTVTAGTSPLTVTKPAKTLENSVLTMTCSKALNTSTASNFYFMVPPGAFSNGFTIKVYRGTGGSTLVETWNTSTDHTISSNHIKIVQATSTVPEPQVTNLLPALSSANWTLSGFTNGQNGTCWNDAQLKAKINNTSGKKTCTTNNTIHVIYGDQYYVRWSTLSHVNGGVGVSANSVEWPLGTAFTSDFTVANQWAWQTNSQIVTATQSTDDYTVSVVYKPNGKSLYEGNYHHHMKEPMIINLTETYTNNGEAIPPISTLNSKPYFTGTILLSDW